MTSQFADIRLSPSFLTCLVFLVKFSFWWKFHVNIIAGSGVMPIFFYKGLARNQVIRNSPSKFFPIFGDWEELSIPNLAQIYLMKSYWMLQNRRATAFIFSELLRENNRERGKITPLPPRLGLKKSKLNANVYVITMERFLKKTPLLQILTIM